MSAELVVRKETCEQVMWNDKIRTFNATLESNGLVLN